MTERESLGMVFALQKYRHYLLANPFVFYIDHQALKYLVNKPLHHGRIYRWLLLFQSFEFEIIVRPGKANVGPNYLSRIDIGEEVNGIEDDLLDALMFKIESISSELAETTQFLENGQAPEGMGDTRKKILAMKVAPYSIINKFLYKLGLDEVLHRCVLDHERESIMHEAHYDLVGIHVHPETTTKKIQQSGLWWLTIYQDFRIFVSKFDRFQ